MSCSLVVRFSIGIVHHSQKGIPHSLCSSLESCVNILDGCLHIPNTAPKTASKHPGLCVLFSRGLSARQTLIQQTLRSCSCSIGIPRLPDSPAGWSWNVLSLPNMMLSESAIRPERRARASWRQGDWLYLTDTQ